MVKDNVKSNDRRFRRGSLALLFVSVLSAASTGALYAGFQIPFLYMTSLAVPVVTDIALQTFFSGWIWMEKVRYYWFLGATVLATILALIGFLSAGISFSGDVCHRSFAGRSLNRVFSAFGLAQRVSARALSAFGILFYLLDVVVSIIMVLVSPQTFTPYYFFLMGNLLLHFVVLSFLGFSFTASVGGGRVDSRAEPETHGAEK